MNSLIIRERLLSDEEQQQIAKQSRTFVHLGTINPDVLQKLQNVNKFYIAEYKKDFVGFCMVVKLKKWNKIGPVIILEKFQGKGYGKRLLAEVVSRNSQYNLYIGSSHPKICQIVLGLGFKGVDSYWRLPNEIKVYIIRYFFERLNTHFIIDSLKKMVKSKSRYQYFLRLPK